MTRRPSLPARLLCLCSRSRRLPTCSADPLPGTQPLEMQGDLAEQMVAGIDRFLLRQDRRIGRHARRGIGSATLSIAEKYNASVAPNRARLAKIIGAHEPREPVTALELVATTAEPALVGRGENFEAFAVRWPARARRARRRTAARAQVGPRRWPTWSPFPMPIRRPSNWRALRRASRPRRSSPGGWPRAAAACSCRR